jgi:poly-gamma-glutamate synthesis protein (capsule biosynthesis protein)
MKFKYNHLLPSISIVLFGLFGVLISLPIKNDLFATRADLPKTQDTTRQSISLFFVGDLMGHKPMIDAAKTATGYEYEHWFKHIKNRIEKYDLSILNLEVTLAGEPYSGYPMFCSPDSYAKAAQNVGFNFFITANNHSIDRGKKGLERTLDVLDSLKIAHTGTFKDENERGKLYPYYWNFKGAKIAVLNYTYGTNGIKITPPNVVNMIDTMQIKLDIQKAKKDGSNFIITTIHWGNEYQRKESVEQSKLAQWLADQGVDAIIGMHPHVVQPMKIIHPKNNQSKSVPVAYSLGNFVSNQRERYKNGGIGVELQLEVLNGKVTWQTWGYYPFWIQLGGKPKGYYVIPTSDWENKINSFGLNEQDKTNMKQFSLDTRELLKGIKELKD